MTKKSHSLTWWYVAICASASACGGGSSTPVTPVAYCSQKATKECDGVALNCSVTATACQAARVSACSSVATDMQLNHPERPFRPEKVDACVSKTAEIFKKSPITPADRAALDLVCQRVFSGSKKANEDCPSGSDYECDTGLICDTTLPVAKCAVQTIVSGMFCGNPGEVCPTGKYCSGDVGARQCMPVKAMGETCDPVTAPCLDSLYCSATTMTCVPKLMVSQSCTLDSDCAATAPYCDPYRNKTCDVGFAPSPFSPECAAYGATTPSGAGGAG